MRSLKQALEFEQWFIVEYDRIQVAYGAVSFSQYILNRPARKCIRMFLSREALFLRSRDYVSMLVEECRRAIMVVRGDA